MFFSLLIYVVHYLSFPLHSIILCFEKYAIHVVIDWRYAQHVTSLEYMVMFLAKTVVKLLKKQV